jgi:uncharacterized protein YceH (UPF0502 family)
MALTEKLDAVETRILGVLVEKQLTTPESYPLSLNALLNGCNQKSNRDPVVTFTEQTVSEALLRLRLHRAVREVHSAGARVEKYEHLAGEVLELETPALAVITELMLRGPQTAGQLRGRVQRMSPINSLPELEALIKPLEGRGMIGRFAPAAGSRAGRVGHLLGDPAERPTATVPATHASGLAEPETPQESAHTPTRAPVSTPGAPTPGPASVAVAGTAAIADLSARVAALETDVARLRTQLDTRPGHEDNPRPTH